MSFLHGKTDSKHQLALIAIAGVAAYTFPLVPPWHLFLLCIPAIVGFRVVEAPVLWGIAIGALAFSALTGFVSSSLAVALSAAFLLAFSGREILAAAVLLLQTSFVATLQALLSDVLAQSALEAAAPAVVAIAVMSLAEPRSILSGLAAAFLAAGLAWLCGYVAGGPETISVLAALAALAFAARLAWLSEATQGVTKSVPIAFVFFLAIGTWTFSTPRSWDRMYILLPDAPEAAEAKYFKNYVEALRFAGVNAERISRADELSPNSLLIMPWLTAPLPDEGKNDALLRDVGRIAKERRVTVLAAGEHTNLGNVASRLQAITGRSLLRSDLTVPRGNRDESGLLHTAGVKPWPHDGILNRGASVIVQGVSSKVLLAADGWWSEPDIGEWLWVGDYVWNVGDRGGRIPLAASADLDGARWIVVGDGSFLINHQLIADPRPFLHLLNLASLWPAFWLDMFLVLAAVSFVFFKKAHAVQRSGVVEASMLASIGIAVFLSCMGSVKAAQAWERFYRGESGFSDRNFDQWLAEHPALFSGQDLIRSKAPLSGKVWVPDRKSVIFGLVDGAASFGPITAGNCRRMGALKTEQGPYLMDAQACQIEGPAEILIGTAAGAAAFRIRTKSKTIIVVLDEAFLSKRAPEENAVWLERVTSEN